MMRAITAGLIGFGCFLASMFMVRSMKDRLQLLESWRAAVMTLRDAVTRRLLPLPEALREYKSLDACHLWLDTLASATDIDLAWSLLLKSLQTTPMNAADYDCLTPLITTLGRLPLAEQRESFDSALRELDARIDAARADLARNGRLYTTLGSLAGMMAAVCII